MIRVELGEEVHKHGKWQWRLNVGGATAEGLSKEPLLDACREVKRMGGDMRQRIGLFRNGRDHPDLTCSVGTGAGRTVDENRTPYFAKWKIKPPSIWRTS